MRLLVSLGRCPPLFLANVVDHVDDSVVAVPALESNSKETSSGLIVNDLDGGLEKTSIFYINNKNIVIFLRNL